MGHRLYSRGGAKNPGIAREPTSSDRQIQSDRYATLCAKFYVTCADIGYEKPRVVDEKVKYRDSLGQSVKLAVLKVVEDETGDITYWLRRRGSKERYYDWSKGVFGGDELEDDDSSITD